MKKEKIREGATGTPTVESPEAKGVAEAGADSAAKPGSEGGKRRKGSQGGDLEEGTRRKKGNGKSCALRTPALQRHAVDKGKATKREGLQILRKRKNTISRFRPNVGETTGPEMEPLNGGGGGGEKRKPGGSRPPEKRKITVKKTK